MVANGVGSKTGGDPSFTMRTVPVWMVTKRRPDPSGAQAMPVAPEAVPIQDVSVKFGSNIVAPAGLHRRRVHRQRRIERWIIGCPREWFREKLPEVGRVATI